MKDETMHIGIVTSAKELNFGAILQAFALQDTVARLGYDAELLWWDNQKEKHHDIRIRKLSRMLIRFIKYPSLFKKCFRTYKEAFEKKFNEESINHFKTFEDARLNIHYLSYLGMKQYATSEDCIAIIAGSDQIWNSYSIYVDPFYYLRFAPKEKRIAYAPSIGKSNIPEYNEKIMRKYIKDFSCLSIREKSAKKQLESLVGREIPVVLDPSFLLDRDEWSGYMSQIKCPDNYVLLYFLDEPSSRCINRIQKIVKDLNCEIVAFPYKFALYSEFSEITYVEPGPAEFLTLISKAKFIFTDSFHGTAFCINFNKQFYTFDRQYGNNQSQTSRITDILEMFNLSSRFVKDEKSFVDINSTIDYERVNEILIEERIKSEEYLLKSIEKVKDDCTKHRLK